MPQIGIESTQVNGRKSTKSQQIKKRKAIDEKVKLEEEVVQVRQTTSRSAFLASKQNKTKEEQTVLEENVVEKMPIHKSTTARGEKNAAIQEDPIKLPTNASLKGEIFCKPRKEAIEHTHDASDIEGDDSLITDGPKNSTGAINGNSLGTVKTRRRAQN
jgi:hypothetical protein